MMFLFDEGAQTQNNWNHVGYKLVRGLQNRCLSVYYKYIYIRIIIYYISGW